MFEKYKLKRKMLSSQQIYRQNRNEENNLYDQMEELISQKKCGICPDYNSGNVNTYSERFEKCRNNCCDELKDISSRLDNLEKKYNDFSKKVYALDIFNYLNVKSPKLIDSLSGENKTWTEAFGDNFDSLSDGLKSSLIGLMEGGGKYRFK